VCVCVCVCVGGGGVWLNRYQNLKFVFKTLTPTTILFGINKNKYKTLKKISRFIFPIKKKKKRKKVYIIYMSQTLLKVQPSRSSSFSPLDFYLCERLQTPAYSSPIENEEMFY